MIRIFAWKIYKKQVSLNKKQIILAFTKLRFETQLCVESNAKNISYLTNQTDFFCGWTKKQKLP